MTNLTTLSNKELLRLSEEIIEELISRGVAKTRNKPISDYSKWLIIKGLNLKDADKIKEKCDAIDSDGKRYLVRSRQTSSDNTSAKFSVIRDTLYGKFDYLVAITFDKYFDVDEAYLIPYEQLCGYLEFSEHQNGYILLSSRIDLYDPQIKDIKSKLIGLN